MADDDRTPPRPTADEGTELGASTNLLTRLFAIVMWPIVAVPRLVHAIGRGVRHRFGGEHRRLRRLGVIAASAAEAITALIRRAVRGVGAALRPIGAASRSVERFVVAIVRPIGLAVTAAGRAAHTRRPRDPGAARSCSPGHWPRDRAISRSAVWNGVARFGSALGSRVARVAVATWTMFARAGGPLLAAFSRLGGLLRRGLDATGRAIGRLISIAALVLRVIGRGVARPMRAGGHAFAALARSVMAVARSIATVVSASTHYVAERLGRPLRRVVGAVGRGIGKLLSGTAHAIRVVARAAARPIRAACRAVVHWLHAAGHAAARPIRACGRKVAELAAPPLRTAQRGLAATSRVMRKAATHVAAVVRRVSERIVFSCRRIAHSVGVAFLRARLMNGSTRTPATDPHFASADHAPPALVPFEAAVFQNEWLPRGGREVHAIMTVTAHKPPDSDGDSAPEAAEVILVDCSGSMGHPWQKLRAARTATAAAVNTLRDGTWFAIVRGSHTAEPVYPLGGGLVRATKETRLDALSALGLLWPEGGTAMGQWLTLARELFDTRPHAIPHAILLTDGKNESEAPAHLEAALKGVAGRFPCDCRGVGTDWDVAELRTISSQMLGTVDIVPDPADLAADFESMTAAAMAKRVGDTRLRVWTPQGAVVHFLQQVAPEVQDITTQRRPVGRQTGEYAIGSWGDESRDYHLCVRVPDKPIGAEMLAARVSVVVGEHVVTSSQVRAIWTDDEEAVTSVNPQVAHYTGQTELVALIQEGVGARRAGDDDRATEKLGHAAQVAHASGNDVTLQLLANVVDIVDAPTGQVRLKAHVELADEMALDTRSAKTVRVELGL